MAAQGTPEQQEASFLQERLAAVATTNKLILTQVQPA